MKTLIKILCLSILWFSCSGKFEGDTYVNGGGSRKVDIKGENDDLEAKIEVNTYNYDHEPTVMGINTGISSGKNDPFFRAYIDKKNKEITSLQLYVSFSSRDWIFWDEARFKINDELVSKKATRIASNVDCSSKIETGCAHYEDVILEIDFEMLEDWAISGKTIRFASSKINYTQDVTLTSNESKDFLNKVKDLSK